MLKKLNSHIVKLNSNHKKLYMSAFVLCTVPSLRAQEVVWQKDIKSSTQDFLSQVTSTIDQQYLITGSLIQSKKLTTENKQNINANWGNAATYNYFGIGRGSLGIPSASQSATYTWDKAMWRIK